MAKSAVHGSPERGSMVQRFRGSEVNPTNLGTLNLSSYKGSTHRTTEFSSVFRPQKKVLLFDAFIVLAIPRGSGKFEK